LFDIEIENIKQEFILFISPLSSILLVFGVSLFLSGKWRNRYILFTNFMFTLVLVGNSMFYKFYDDFVTLPVLFQTDNMGDLGTSVMAILNIGTFLMFIDTFILWWLGRKNEALFPTKRVGYRGRFVYMLTVVAVFMFNLALAEIERPQLLTRTFDREMLVKNIGLYNYHVYDVTLQARTSAKRAMANSDELANIETYLSSKQNRTDKDMFAAAKGKNVILVSVESMQSFLINNTINGEPVTPFLNEFLKESFYFENFYHQTAQGKTADAEFITDHSMYPLDRGSVFFTHATNEWRGVPEIVKEKGYSTAVFHANNASFWNRDIVYPNVGYDRYFDVNSYDVTEENSIGWGLKDKEFFEQSMTNLKELPQPFYAKFITLTNHFPFDLAPEDASVDQFDSNSKTLNQYFQTARYLDESLEYFVELLKEQGLYENSVLVFYGDHYGISTNHNSAMEQYLGYPVTPDVVTQLQRVPFLIHIPGFEGKTIDTVAGQIDYMPTILHLLGISTEDTFAFGTDLFSPDKDDFVAFRDGGFVNDKYIYTGGKLYNKQNGEVLDKEVAREDIERVEAELQHSDRIIYGDLLRFNQ
ncbi:MAG: LTA synthase family protein, partial [Bacilli bacterium]